MAKKKDITTQKDAELIKMMNDLREELRNARSAFGAEGKDVKAQRDIRRDIARIQTELNNRARQSA